MKTYPTQSFFEQDRKKKFYGWQRACSNDPNLPGRPPLPASYKTRTKLKEYIYTGEVPDCTSMLSAGGGVTKKVDQEQAEPKPDDMAEARKLPLPHANTFPSTPSDRLTLDELMGEVDASRFKQPVESPEEILGWDPTGSDPDVTPGRKRKRAQSSSPGYLSASAEKSVRNIHKTPIADPAAELWQRYGGQTARLPDISFVMQATPRPIETPVKSAGLRRWASAGNEWPRSKRQRLHAPKIWQDKPQEHSKMVAILDKIQESMADQRRRQDPSSSSPLPDAGAFSPRRRQQHSPMRKTMLGPQSKTSRVGQLPTKSQQPVTTITIEAADLEELAIDVNSDEFDEIDLEAMAAIEETVLARPTTRSPPIKTADLTAFEDDFDDEFGLADMDEQVLLEAELNATQAFSTKLRRHEHNHEYSRNQRRQDETKSPRVMQQPRYRRFRVSMILDKQSTTEKVLSVEDMVSSTACTITLKGTWTDTDIKKDQIIHVAAGPSGSIPCKTADDIIVDDSEDSPLLIVHPDHLLSATAVADSFDCIRKAVLFDRIKATSDASKWTVYGKILHEIFQQALTANTWSEVTLRQLAVVTVEAHLEGLWSIGMRDNTLALEEVSARMTELSAWANVFVRSTPSINGKVKLTKDDSLRMAISGLVAIEEHVWSPMYGLKGNVDATVQIDVTGSDAKTVVMPFEVKTGRTTNATSHHAQTALYTLLMSDRYDVAVKAGILYYLESSDMSWVAPTTHVVRQMIQQRNALASSIHHASRPTVELESNSVQLPDMAKNANKCSRCYAQQSCFTFHALCEDGDAKSAGMIDDSRKNYSDVWHEALGHLMHDKDQTRRTRTKQWFTKWDRLLTFEERETSRPTKELWTMSSADREAAGRCFGELVIRDDQLACTSNGKLDGIEGSGGKINKFFYTFERSKGKTARQFNDGSQLVVGEAIVVSSEGAQWALAKGYITAITPDSVVVGVDRKLGDARQRLQGFDRETNQAFKGIMKVSAKHETVADRQTLYRLDRDEFTNGLALIRSNLVSMMSSHPTHTRLREMIVHDQEPVFLKPKQSAVLPPSQLGQMNEDQLNAVEKVMSAQDYALILGMPGTGKTTTIAHLIRALLAEGLSILLTSYTHTAVDNILLKIKDIAPKGSILRVGVASKVNAQVQQFCHLAATPKTSFQEFDEVYLHTQIVATTCLGINHAVFSRRTFDVCIVDEASQITMPTSLGPLLYARKFVLVGDHYQLSPLVQDREALKGGLDMSLFRLLSEKHPQAVAELGKQYRMCEDIMSISNQLVYGGRLRCGNEAVANRIIKYSTPNGLTDLHASAACDLRQCWLSKVTASRLKVVFANTDKIGTEARECLVNSGKKITNRLEAVITAQVVLALQAQGIAAEDMGVIALYRSQISLIRQLFGAAAIASTVEFDSADRFQGRDKECIIISMVRSNEAGTTGDLINDWRRLNVAFTRARSKLIVIGSRSTLKNNDRMAEFLRLVDDRGQSLDLPSDAESNHGHAFDFVSQATTMLPPSILPTSQLYESPQRRPLQELSQKSHNARKPAKVVNGKAALALKRKFASAQIFEELQSAEWLHEELEV